MAMNYADHINPVENADNSAEGARVLNNAGGDAYLVNRWQQLDRFLILGTEGATAYLGERTQTLKNAEVVCDLLREDGARLVQRIATISNLGRAANNEAAIFALAMAAKLGDDPTRKRAFATLPKVCRIPTHLFSFTEYLQLFGGWGRATRRAVGEWYNNKPLPQLAYHLTKYRQRNGWSHKDVLRLAHPKTDDAVRNALYGWVVGKTRKEGVGDTNGVLKYTEAFDCLQKAQSVADVSSLIEDYGFTHDMVPPAYKKDPQVWKALLPGMPLTALIRNLGHMTKIGVLSKASEETRYVAGVLQDVEVIKKARVHPLQLLLATRVYSNGRASKGSSTWVPVPMISEALDAAFYTAFFFLRPAQKKFLVGIDVSGSMDVSHVGKDGLLTARDAAVTLALVLQRTEPQTNLLTFSAAGDQVGTWSAGGASAWREMRTCVTPLHIDPEDRLDAVIDKTALLPFGGTDCALPMQYATHKGLDVDVFVVLTDNETWAGRVTPADALRAYRAKYNKNAKLVVVALTPTPFTIADPRDPGMLDVVGFDAALPALISGFAADIHEENDE